MPTPENQKKIEYRTRDGKGNDIVKEVKIKKYDTESVNFICKCCNKEQIKGVPIKKIVSSNFTDWGYVGQYVCEKCADLFSLHFYNYIIDPNGIHLYNVRELRNQLICPQTVPFLFVITTTQKKHLFYKSKWNYSNKSFSVNLETESIYTSCDRMKMLFDFVELLQTLGCTKDGLKQKEIPFKVLEKVGIKALRMLEKEIKMSREIQIPLYCGQKRDMTEEEAICCINSILTV